MHDDADVPPLKIELEEGEKHELRRNRIGADIRLRKQSGGACGLKSGSSMDNYAGLARDNCRQVICCPRNVMEWY